MSGQGAAAVPAVAASAYPTNLYGLSFNVREYPTFKPSNNYSVYKDTRCKDLKSCLQNRHISVPNKYCDDLGENMTPHKTIHSTKDTIRTFYFPAELTPGCPNNSKYNSLIKDKRKICSEGLCRLDRTTILPHVYDEINNAINELKNIETFLSYYENDKKKKDKIIEKLNYFGNNYTDRICTLANSQVDPFGRKRTDFKASLSSLTASNLNAPENIEDIEIGMDFKEHVGKFLMDSYEFLSFFVSKLIEKEDPWGQLIPIAITDEKKRVQLIIDKPFTDVSVKGSSKKSSAVGFSLIKPETPQGDVSPQTELVEDVVKLTLQPPKKQSATAADDDQSLKKSEREQNTNKKKIKDELYKYCLTNINYNALEYLKIGDIIDQNYENLFDYIKNINEVIEFKINPAEKKAFNEAIEVIKIVQIFKSALPYSKKIEIILELSETFHNYLSEITNLEYTDYTKTFFNIIYNEHFRQMDVTERQLDFIEELFIKSRKNKIFNDILFLIYYNLNYNWLSNIDKHTKVLFSQFAGNKSQAHSRKTSNEEIDKINTIIMCLDAIYDKYNNLAALKNDIVEKTSELKEKIKESQEKLKKNKKQVQAANSLLQNFQEEQAKLELQNFQEEQAKPENESALAQIKERIIRTTTSRVKHQTEISKIENELQIFEKQISDITNELNNKYYNNIYTIDYYTFYFPKVASAVTHYKSVNTNTKIISILEYNIFDLVGVRMNISREELVLAIQNKRFEDAEQQEQFNSYSENMQIYLANDETYNTFIQKNKYKYNNMYSCYFTLLFILNNFISYINKPETIFNIYVQYIHKHNLERIRLFKKYFDYKLLNDKINLLIHINSILYPLLFTDDDVEKMNFSFSITVDITQAEFIQQIQSIKKLLDDSSETLFSADNNNEDEFINPYYNNGNTYRTNIITIINDFLT